MDPGAALVALMLAELGPLPALRGPPMQQHTGQLVVGLDTDTGYGWALVGPWSHLYRAEPGIVVSIAPGPRVEVFVAAGVGPAYVTGPTGGRIDVTLSGTLGVRFPWKSVPVRALARAESTLGHGTMVMLEVQFPFGR